MEKTTVTKEKFWDEEEILKDIQETENTFMRISKCKREGKDYVCFRRFLVRGGKNVPTRKGFSLNIEWLPGYLEVLNNIK